MAFKPFKLLGKLVGAIIPGGGVISSIISPDKSPEQVKDGLALLDPIAQFNKTMARPRIAIMITATYLLGNIIRWIQQLFGVHEAYLVDIAPELTNFATIVVTAIIGGRGIQEIVRIAKSVVSKGKKK